MKKVTRLLLLTAFVFPILTLSRAYAGGPGQRFFSLGQRERLAHTLHPTDPFRPEDPAGLNRDILGRDPFGETRDPLYGIGDPLDRRDPFGHDPYAGQTPPGWRNGEPGPGGATAPIDGGISLLLAAGLGLGIKKSRARKKAAAEAEQKNVENPE